MSKIKICGLSNVEDALVAAEAGADMLGIVFDPNSRRSLSESQALDVITVFRDIWKKGSPKWVGVFANQPVDEINRLLDTCDIDMAQLSGNESRAYCLRVIRPVIKVIHVRNDVDVESLVEDVRNHLLVHQEDGHTSMLDTFKKGILGGTGQIFDWDVAEILARDYHFMIAGGLSKDNVSRAIQKIRPLGVDVSSGVETNGQKDGQKIVSFITEVRKADGQMESNHE